VYAVDRARDVLSPRAQRDKGFAVASLPEVTSLSGSPLEEALHENAVSPVPEQVSFRIDFPCWRASRTDRDRRLIDDLLLGERTQDVAGRYGLSEARVSQLRREFHDDWERFCGEKAAEPPAGRGRGGERARTPRRDGRLSPHPARPE
jgi:hypothetical protein